MEKESKKGKKSENCQANDIYKPNKYKSKMVMLCTIYLIYV